MPTLWNTKTARFASTQNITEIGHLESGYSVDSLKSLLSKAKPGDVLVMSNGSINHCVIIRSVMSDGIGIYGYDANSDYKNTIRTNQLRKAEDIRRTKPAGVTLYRYVNYADSSTYTITFDPNGGTVSPTSKTFPVGGSGTLPVATRDGYKFIGWVFDKLDPEAGGSQAIVQDVGNWLFDSDLTLYAYWVSNHTHVKGQFQFYDKDHPHYNYYACSTCGTKFTDKSTSYVESCATCNPTPPSNPVTPPPEKTYTVILDDGSTCKQITVTAGKTYSGLTTPTKSGYVFDGWYTQKDGGTKITSSTTVNLTGNQTLYAHWGYWGPWSSWSTTPVTASATRQVETKQVETSKGYTEYRYVGYATTDGKHECWCETYLRSKFGSAVLRYSDWSTTRYSTNGSGWTCGKCSGKHTGVSYYDSQGKPWWGEYTLPGGKNYYWEESRMVAAKSETQYRYRDWISKYL